MKLSYNDWLLKKINDKYSLNIYSESVLPKLFVGNYDIEVFYRYYQDKDIDIKNTCPDVHFIDNQNNDVKEIYGDTKYVMLPPNSNQAHCNFLFKKLVNFSSKIKYDISYLMNYELGKDIINSVVNENAVSQIPNSSCLPMFDVSFKNKFYNFCYNNTNA